MVGGGYIFAFAAFSSPLVKHATWGMLVFFSDFWTSLSPADISDR